ncbi:MULTISPECIES: hypothetical protein [Bacteria]
MAIALVAAVALTGCTAAEAPQAVATQPPPTTSTDPNDVPADDTDYSVDSGNNMPEYEYEDEPAAPPTVVGILCNLNQEYFEGLRSVEAGVAVADDNLRTNLVGLSDLLGETESLKRQYPDSGASIDLAQAIFDKWDAAILGLDNGDASAARAAMADAEDLVEELPSRDAVTCEP